VKYFVTGASGFLGGRVVRQLLDEGHEVVALVRDPAASPDLAAAGIRLVRGDVTEPASLMAPMSGCDGVFHIAGWYKIGAKDRTPGVTVNVQGTRNVLSAMKELRIAKGVYTSTLAVNSDTHGRVPDETYTFAGTHLSEYDRTKALAHDLATAFIRADLPLVIVQPGLIYGPGDRGPSHDLLVQYLQRTLPVVPQRTAFCWAHVDDVARGHLLAMERGRVGESYFLAGPVCTVVEALRLAGQITGVPAPKLTAPPWFLAGLSLVMGVIEQVAPVPDTYSSEYLRVSAGRTYLGDSGKARRELGWAPRRLEDGLAETLQYEMRQLNMPISGQGG
jgi:nucleoside-diphosphate-sugar epimerase